MSLELAPTAPVPPTAPGAQAEAAPAPGSPRQPKHDSVLGNHGGSMRSAAGSAAAEPVMVEVIPPFAPHTYAETSSTATIARSGLWWLSSGEGILVGVVLAVGLGASLAFGLLGAAQLEDDREAGFAVQAAAQQAALQASVDALIVSATSLAAYAGSAAPDVDGALFAEMAQPLVAARVATLLGVAQEVDAAGRDGFEATSAAFYNAELGTTNQSFPITALDASGDVVASGDRDAYWPLAFMSPLATSLINLDLNQTTCASAALALALARQQPAASAPCAVPGDAAALSADTLLLVPAASSQASKKNVSALVVAAADAQAMLAAQAPTLDPGVALVVVDYQTGTFLGGATRAGAFASASTGSDAVADNDSLLATLPVTVASREWRLEVAGSEEFREARRAWVAVGAALLFLLCAAAAASYLYSVWKHAYGHDSRDVDLGMRKLATVEAAAEAERSLNEFIAHEIRNPLAVCCSAIMFVSTAVERERASALAATEAREAEEAAQEAKEALEAKAMEALEAKAKEAEDANSQAQAQANGNGNGNGNGGDEQQAGKKEQGQGAEAKAAGNSQSAKSATTTPKSSKSAKTKEGAAKEKGDAAKEKEKQGDGVLADLALVDASLRYIDELLRNMLDLNRFSARVLELKSSPVRVRQDVLEPMLAQLRLQVPASLRLSLECPEELHVMADKGRLSQLVGNLAKNAARFVPSGGFVRLAAWRDASHVGWVHLRVEDSGPGIPEERRAELFLKHQESLDRLQQGTGVALNLCAVLTERMGGTIKLDPAFASGEPGSPGAAFQVSLPLKELPHATPSDADADADAGTGSGTGTLGTPGTLGTLGTLGKKAQGKGQRPFRSHATVLHVDDDAMIRMMSKRLLKKSAKDWTFCEAPSGEKALEMAAAQHFDLILMDHYMPANVPTLTGEATIRALRARGCSSVIVGCSANDMERCHMAAGADGFRLKPLPNKAVEMVAFLNAFSPVPPGLRVLALSAEAVSRSILVRTLRQLGHDMDVVELDDPVAALRLLCPDADDRDRDSDRDQNGNGAPEAATEASLDADEAGNAGNAGNAGEPGKSEAGVAGLRPLDGGGSTSKSKSKRFDVVIMEDQLGNVNLPGSQLAHRLRSEGVSSVLVLVTGDMLDDEVACNIVWTKPFPSIATMRKDLNKALAHTAIRQGSVRLLNLSN